MNAYSLVNNQVRKKLDEMLKTWKEPVPGSLDPRPVFPVDTTRPIENALIKARTLAVQQQQQQARSQQEMLSRSRPNMAPSSTWRNTPTPPQTTVRYSPPALQTYQHQNLQNGPVQVSSVTIPSSNSILNRYLRHPHPINRSDSILPHRYHLHFSKIINRNLRFSLRSYNQII